VAARRLVLANVAGIEPRGDQRGDASGLQRRLMV
jgi:hypothetical protein